MENRHQALHVLINKDDQGAATNFEEILEQNIQKACEILQVEPTKILDLVPELSSKVSSASIQWKFINLAFYILFLEENEGIISVIYLKDTKVTFQFIISMGILPNLIPGVGLDMNMRFKNANKFPSEEIDIKEKYYRLSSITKILLKCLNIDSLRNFILENHFNDTLASLLQLTAAPLKKPDGKIMTEDFYYEIMNERKYFQNELQNLILTTHQPLVFRELMLLNGNKKAPNWLKGSLFNILTERLQSKNGVESIIRALFDSESQDVGASWKYWDILTKLLMTKPKYINEKDYFDNICGQIFKLLLKRNFDNKRVPKFETCFVQCTKCLYENNESLCLDHFVKILLKKLLIFTETEEVKNNVTDDIEQIIYLLYSIFIENKTNEKIIPIENIQPVFLVLYNIFLNCYKSERRIKKQLLELLTKFIESYENKKDIYDNFLIGLPINDIPHLKNYTFEINEEINFVKKSTESRCDCCEYFIRNCKNEKIITSFFTYLLNTFISTDVTYLNLLQYEIKLQLVLKLLEDNTLINNLKNPTEFLIFAENFLTKLVNKGVHNNSESLHYQILFVILMIISEVLKNNNKLLNDFNILSSILRKICTETNNNELKLLINEIFNKENESKKSESDYEKAMDEICSPLIPEQAHGLATLVKLVENKDPETHDRKQYVLNIFQQNLLSEESFIYLRAIAGLAALADAFPSIVIKALTDEYAHPRGASDKDNEIRMKLGEVLVRATTGLGESAVKYKSLLLNTFLSTVKDPDPLIRASSLSNLGEVCKVLGFRLGTIITEILNCVNDVICYDLAVEVRRAAVTVIRQLFIGLDKELLSFLKEDILPIYRQLKILYRDDPDDVTRLQAQLALEELNEIMKSLLAPEINLSKVVIN